MQQLPINTLALPDFTKVAVIGGKERKAADARLPPPVGILKIDWLWKHRTRVPAALIVLLTREEVYGDPAQWAQVCTNLDTIKNIIRGRNTKLVVVVVQSTFSNGDVVEDRMLALRKRAEVDPKYLLTFVSQELSEQKRSLARVGSILAESVNTFYREEGRRIKLRLEKRTFSSIELSVRYNFKVAVYAEFRRDWVESLKSYETAYSLLQEIVTTPIELQPIQRLVELKAVAEQLHFKVSTLLLHGGKEAEAVKWFRQHMTFYKCLVGPVEGSFMHWSWVSKQFLVLGDLLQNSLAKVVTPPQTSSAVLPESPVTERELQPGYYYQVAARFILERRRSFESVSSMFDSFEGEPVVDVLEGPAEEVGPPLYVGQSPCLLSRGTSFDVQCPTEREFMYHAVLQERMFPHSAAAINLLKRAYEQYKLIQAGRMVYRVASEMGRVYFNARDYANAKQLFDTVAGMYRQEAWVALLWATLGFLRECARHLWLLREYIEYSLEMASLPTSLNSDGSRPDFEAVFGPEVGPAGPLCHMQREQVFKEVIGLLHGKHSVLPAREGETGLTVEKSDSVSLNIDVASPLRAVLAVCVAFHEQMVKPGMTTFLTLSLLTHLPQTLELEELELHFNQLACNVVLQSSKRDSVQEETIHDRIKGGFDLHLEPNKWKRFSIDIIPGHSGKLECVMVTARLVKSAVISCQVESPASRDEVLFWKFEPQLEILPMKDSSLSCFGQKTIQVEEPDPLIDLNLESFGPGLEGELFPIGITVKSKGHAVHVGEVKISIVESTTMSIISSPTTPSSSEETCLVELFTTDSICQEDVQGIQNIKKCSGILAVPVITADKSWSTQVYLKWKKAKPVSLFVSFGYQTETVASEANPPYQYFVRKGLQLDCEEPFTLRHRYMAPFRRDALLLGSLSKGSGSGKETSCIPVNESSALVLIVRNSSSVKLELVSIIVDEANSRLCSISAMSSLYGKPDCPNLLDSGRQLARQSTYFSTESGKVRSIVLMPGEAFTKLFCVRPTKTRPSMDIGTVCVKWRRWMDESESVLSSDALTIVDTDILLPAVQVEKPPLLITFHCPPHAILGVPFTVSMSLENLTPLFQEVKYSIVDSPCFILSGAHSDSVHILPYAKDIISYKLVSIASGQQQLPQLNLTAARYNAGFQQSLAGTQLFIFPSPYSKPLVPLTAS